MSGTPFQELLDAVASYYGTGSDQWLEIAQYGLNADNCADILSQIPNVSTTVAKNGDILSYTVDNVASVATQGASSAINSNTQTALMTQTVSVNTPAQMSVNTAGKVTIEGGVKKLLSTEIPVTSTVGKVAVGVGAVMAGVQFGAKIDKLLYNAFPDFFESHNMSNFNPETWDSICTTQFGKDVFNVVFGIDKDSGETQAYMDERALAYIAQYLNSKGAFETAIVDPGSSSIDVDISYPISYHIGNVGVDTSGTYRIVGLTDQKVAIVTTESNYHLLIVADDTSWNNGQLKYPDGGYGGLGYNRNLNIDDKRVYYRPVNLSNTDVIGLTALGIPIIHTGNENLGNGGEVAWVMVYGEEQVGKVDGITSQDDSVVLPLTVTPDLSIDDAIAQLRILYPDLFNDAVYNDVVQPDGSVKRYTYVPVPIPDNISVNDTTSVVEPTGGVEEKQDAEPISDTSPQSIIDTLLEIITSTNPYSPTPSTPTTPTTYPDTGTGNTPAIVTPTGSASALYSIYNPTQAEVNSFGAWLWSNDFVEQLKKIFNDPMQSIIGLHKIFATPSTSGTGTIKVGYLNSGVSSKLVSDQYTEIDCGSVNLLEYFGNVLDYLNTDIYCYLPFIGIVPLNVSDVMRGEINIKYKIDVLTGACLCSINVKRDMTGGQLYTYSGNCAVQYPLSSGSYMGIVSSALSIAGSVVGTIASGGALLPVALGLSAGAISNAKTKVEMSGNITGSSGAMGIKKPYFIIRRPQTKIAENYPNMDGGSNNVFTSLSNESGFIKVKYIHLENIPATDTELDDIVTKLHEGVLI